MCGGSIEMIPCSHVGHIFRERIPYLGEDSGSSVAMNTVRLAEVWLDDYKRYYYDRFPHVRVIVASHHIQFISLIYSLHYK